MTFLNFLKIPYHDCLLIGFFTTQGRAWIRMALMEKRLAEYLLEAIKHTAVTKQFYHDNAILLSDDVQQVCSMLLGLNAIDFR